jgi:long-chain fatty acid transport protein
MLSGCTGAQCGFTSFLTASSVIRVDFSDGDFTNSNGAAKGDGFAGKLGFAWKLDPAFSVGASYHSKTHLDDLKSDSGCLSAVGVGTLGCGKIKVEDFQWPAIAAIGMAWNVDPSIMVAADVKRIYWRDVMKNFKMTYSGTVNAGAFGLGTGDNDIGFTMQQDWENQTVYQLGGSWKASDPLTLRAGYNYAKSPIPPTFVNPLFPAIMEKHYTVGAGYALDKASAVDFGFAYAPQVEATNGYGVTSATGGTSFQLMYSSKF